MPKCTFARDEQQLQAAYFEKHFGDRTGHRSRPFQLRAEHKFDGLLPMVREPAQRIFSALNIQWHPFIGHGRSSQACCINFLMPFADKPRLLLRWLDEALELDAAEVLPVEDPAAADFRYIAFEYTGPEGTDFLEEAGGGVPGRGAHATASDAAVAFADRAGKRHLLLIEWKYSEEYRSHRLSPDHAGKRQARYAAKTFAPHGPVCAELCLEFSDFLHEPFYQLLRQQLLAWQIERRSNFDRVRVLHLSPAGNRALHHVTAPAFRTVGGVTQCDAFAAFRSCLVDPSEFIERNIEDAFSPLAGWAEADWFAALAERYPSLCPAVSLGIDSKKEAVT